MYTVNLKKKILDANEEAAFKNSRLFHQYKIKCLNVISSPGSGKTTILSRTIEALKGKIKIGVVEGDLKTDLDTQKIKKTGAAAIQIETNGAGHLSAEQVYEALQNLPLAKLNLVFIENVGNLVCPSDFVLGEHGRVVVLSTAEGDDKPAKYPSTFAKADILLINKIDLLGNVDFDTSRVRADALKLNKNLKIFEISAKTAAGLQNWYDYLLGFVAG